MQNRQRAQRAHYKGVESLVVYSLLEFLWKINTQLIYDWFCKKD
jgi:hypothetical protein